MNVFITGASSGIGEALAQEFAARGATLGLVARRKEMLELLLKKLPGKHYIYAADVTDKYRMREIGAQFELDSGGADIVIANAGISIGVLTEHFEDLEAFADTFNTNVLAVAHTFHPFITPMSKRGRGHLVGIASVAGIRGLPGSEAYCASKAAVINYCESLRVELKKSGVQVQTILPGFIKTSMTDKNPYGATTLEWTTPIEHIHGNWYGKIPTVHRWAYDYSKDGKEFISQITPLAEGEKDAGEH